MRRIVLRYCRELATALSLVILVAMARSVIADCILDGPRGIIAAILMADSTVYSDGYSSLGFLRIKNGMTSDDVIGLVGIPLYQGRDCHEEGVLWVYGTTDTDSSYHVRTVVLVKGIVVGKISEFYID